ncbi:hypothetical protein Tco_1399202 [Tanacetum coccineum]
MLVQPTEDEGAGSERPSEPQPTPSPPHTRLMEDTTQAAEIKALKAQVKKLKKQARPLIRHHKAWLRAGRRAVKSSSKAEPTVHKDLGFDDFDEMDYMETHAHKEEGVSTEAKVRTDKQKVSIDKHEVSTDQQSKGTDKASISTDEQDEVLINMSQAKAISKEKEKGVELKDVENIERLRPTSTRSVLTLKHLPKIDPKDKGKKRIEEEESDTESEDINETEKKFKMLAHDEEIARKMQEDWEAKEERKRLVEEEATNDAFIRNYDDIHARIEADRLLALRLQEEEREQFTVEERAKFLYDTVAAQRRFLTQQRAVAIRNRPPTRTQLRNQMMTYLKHVGNKKHLDLKHINFEEIQVLYEKVKRFDESFTAVGSTEDERKIKEMNEGAKDPEQKQLKKRIIKETPKEDDTSKVPAKLDMKEQSTKKRKGGYIKMIARKKPRQQPDVDSDDEHRKCLRVVALDSTIDSEVMETKSFIARLNKVSSPDGDYLVIYRANGHFRAFNCLLEVLHIFDRQDLFHLYELVMEQYSEITLEGIELILWGDLKIMMESSTKENDQ